MKTLYLLRHAKSAWDDATLADHDRPLAPRGERAALVVGRYLAQENYRPDLVLCSTARRAQDTWSLVAHQLTTGSFSDTPVTAPRITTQFDPGLYLSGPKGILKRLAEVGPNSDTVMVVGHNPDLEQLVIALVEDRQDPQFLRIREKLPTASFIALRLSVDRWEDAANATAQILHFAVPKDLV